MPAAERHAPALKIPDGFTVELVAGPPLVEHPTMAGFDDQGRLYVCDGPGMYLPAKELTALRKAAARSGRSISDIIREAIRRQTVNHTSIYDEI